MACKGCREFIEAKQSFLKLLDLEKYILIHFVFLIYYKSNAENPQQTKRRAKFKTSPSEKFVIWSIVYSVFFEHIWLGIKRT